MTLPSPRPNSNKKEDKIEKKDKRSCVSKKAQAWAKQPRRRVSDAARRATLVPPRERKGDELGTRRKRTCALFDTMFCSLHDSTAIILIITSWVRTRLPYAACGHTTVPPPYNLCKSVSRRKEVVTSVNFALPHPVVLFLTRKAALVFYFGCHEAADITGAFPYTSGTPALPKRRGSAVLTPN